MFPGNVERIIITWEGFSAAADFKRIQGHQIVSKPEGYDERMGRPAPTPARNKTWDWVICYLVPPGLYRLYRRIRYGRLSA